MSILYTDRYQALGMSYPDPETVCVGPCEGVGWYPEQDPASPDGWRFLECPACGGTGKRGASVASPAA